MPATCKHRNAVFVAGFAPGESGPKDEELAATVIQKASQLGVTLINTADKLTDAGWAPGGARLTAGFCLRPVQCCLACRGPSLIPTCHCCCTAAHLRCIAPLSAWHTTSPALQQVPVHRPASTYFTIQDMHRCTHLLALPDDGRRSALTCPVPALQHTSMVVASTRPRLVRPRCSCAAR